MKNPLELIQFGKEISEDYVRNNTPLTASLEKIAETHGLNKQEMYRVAETANVEAYLKVFSKSEDKCFDFPLADVNTAYNNILTKTASIETDYEDDYKDLTPRVDFSFDLYNKRTESIVKEAEARIDIQAIINQVDRLNGTLEYIGNDLEDIVVTLANDYDNIFGIVKQAMLSGSANFMEVKEFIKVASPNNFESLAASLKEDLQKIMPIYNFEKTASIAGSANKNSELYQAIINYDAKLTHIEKVAETFLEYEKEFDKINEENKLGITKKAGFVSKALKVGGTALAGAAALLIGGATLGAKIQKDHLAAGQVLNKENAINAMINARTLR